MKAWADNLNVNVKLDQRRRQARRRRPSEPGRHQNARSSRIGAHSGGRRAIDSHKTSDRGAEFIVQP
jgi:hypothetical protein